MSLSVCSYSSENSVYIDKWQRGGRLVVVIEYQRLETSHTQACKIKRDQDPNQDLDGYYYHPAPLYIY